MAQLPPKIPNMAASWPDIMFSGGHHKKLPIPSPFTGNGCGGEAGGGGQTPSWVDEFLDFSAARRGAHRRSASDSIAFLESVPILDGGGNHSGGVRPSADRGDFDRFDDEQFLSMFTDEISPVGPTLSSSNPSTPSDHNSINDEKHVQEKVDHHPPPPQQQTTVAVKSSNEAEDVQSPCNSSEDPVADGTFTAGEKDPGNRIVDPKRVKRYNID